MQHENLFAEKDRKIVFANPTHLAQVRFQVFVVCPFDHRYGGLARGKRGIVHDLDYIIVKSVIFKPKRGLQKGRVNEWST